MNNTPQSDPKKPITRRTFVSTASALGTGIVLSSTPAKSLTRPIKKDELNIAIVGFGSQGKVLVDSIYKIGPSVRIKAVCDIWPYKIKKWLSKMRGKKVQIGEFNTYQDFHKMLDHERDLDCVIIASPDFVHAEHTNAALRAGCHVYCEKLMSNTVEGARSMVQTQRETGKLLQIGHQRRSNPRYQFIKDTLIDQVSLCGQITAVNGQWNRAVTADIKSSPGIALDETTLNRYGYRNMHEFENWRWYKRYGGGPLSDLGAHQIDIYNWFLGNNPKSVIAEGGVDFYPGHEWYDNVMVVYRFDTNQGTTRAFYQVQTTTSAGGGYYEYFMGTEGAIRVSENHKYSRIFQEALASTEEGANQNPWIKWQKQGLIVRNDGTKSWEKPKSLQQLTSSSTAKVDSRETAPLVEWNIPITLGNKSIHQCHLENFFDAVRGEATLNCPADVAFASTVTVLAANEAVAAEKKLYFSPQDFIA